MILLALGVALWAAAHVWKRLAPAQRAGFGERGKAIVSLALLASIVLMVVGYRAADGAVWWAPTPMLKGINNLLILAGFYLFAASGMKSAAARRLRHPQLVGFSLWAGAHLLVNGDAPSFVLFGGLLLWALAEIVLINRAEPDRRPPPPPVEWGKEARVAAAALLVFLAVGWLHGWLGPRPWGA